MKKLFCFLLCLGVLVAPTVVHAQKTKKPKKVKSLEGERVMVVNEKIQGIEFSETLSEDGTEIIKRPYRWYAGFSEANDKQIAIELAQREAYATLSRVLNNTVTDQAQRASLANNGVVMTALKSHWEQVSRSIQSACEPFGDAKIEYSQKTGMYAVTAKISIRGDQYVKLLQSAGSYSPMGLTEEQTKQFININQSIIDAAKQ